MRDRLDRALRRGDAGDRFDRDAGLAAGPISSPARPKIIGSPPLSRTTRRPALAQADHQAVDLVLLAGGAVAGLADQHLLRLAPGELEDFRRHQIVDTG